MKTPMWLAAREGLLDCRLRLALENCAPKDDPALKLWDVAEYRSDIAKWTDAELQRVRIAMVTRMAELLNK
jgi:hypothetical protein